MVTLFVEFMNQLCDVICRFSHVGLKVWYRVSLECSSIPSPESIPPQTAAICTPVTILAPYHTTPFSVNTTEMMIKNIEMKSNSGMVEETEELWLCLPQIQLCHWLQIQSWVHSHCMSMLWHLSYQGAYYGACKDK